MRVQTIESGLTLEIPLQSSHGLRGGYCGQIH